MSASDDVASLPGGDALRQLAEQVKGDTATIDTVTSRWSKAGGDIEQESAALNRSVAVVDSAWQGSSADGFVSYMGRFKTAGSRVSGALDNASTNLGKASQALQEAHTAVESICENLLAARQKIVDQNPTSTRAQLDAAVAPLVAQAVNEAKPYVEQADETLGQVVAALAGDKDDLSPTYSSIPEAGSQAFTPSAHTKIQWVPTPKTPAAAASSSLASSGGGGGAVGYSGGHGGGGGYAGGGGGGGGVSGANAGGPPSRGVAAPPEQVKEWIAEATQILEANGVPAADINAQALWIIIQHESGGNPMAVNNWDCLTDDTQVLTRRGWLKHDQVEVGDETVGYDIDTGVCAWTPITKVVHYDDAPLVRIGNARWHATTTPNHRWVNLPRVTFPKAQGPDVCPECGWESRSEQRKANSVAVHRGKMHGVVPERQRTVYKTEAEFVTSSGIRSRDRLLLAAPMETASTIDVTVREAAMLGWIAGDGHVEKYRDVPRGRKSPTMSIAQSKPAMVLKLKELLADVPHACYVDEQLTRTGKKACGPRHVFRLDIAYAKDLMRRAGHPKQDAVVQVLAMSRAQREAWLEAFIDAEGTRQGGHTRVVQTYGTILDAAHLAVYLCGYRPRLLDRKVTTPGWSSAASIALCRPVVTGGFLRQESAGSGNVWCVSTVSGTWTAMHDGQMFLTGNSNAAAGDESKGLMQCITTTFNAHSLPGHTDIYNPVDNIIAGTRYALGRYGSLANVPGVRAVESGGAYVGY